jgi:NADPH:quinone reductase-like Zn-dependent oxidoreductase
MHAWILERYGSADDLAYREIPFPAFRDDNEVLIRVVASSVNPVEKHALKPMFLFRRRAGFLRPKDGRIGSDVAGRVEVVGRNVQGLHVGDEVYGVGRGSLGEFAIADQSQVVVKPAGLSFEPAAALPIAGVTALQGLRDQAQLRPGQRVLVNGASGGVGTFAVQIAKALGAEVSAVCSTRNVDQARSLGAVRVFDYSKEEFTESGQRYDVIFDLQLNRPLSAIRRILNPQGVYLMVGAGPGNVARIVVRLLGRSLAARIVGPRTKFYIAKITTGELQTLSDLVGSGRLTPVIDRSYPMNQVPDALRYLIEGHARGKIVITTSDSPPGGVV